MKSCSKNFLLLVVLLGFAVAAHGQGMGHAAVRTGGARNFSSGHSSSSARTRPAAIPPPGNSHGNIPGNVPGISNGEYLLPNGLTLNELLNNNVPGLGFDYTHLNALQGNLGVEALIDPATQAQLALALKFLRASPQVPFGGGLWAMPTPVETYDESAPETAAAAPPQPQVIVVQAPAAAQPAAEDMAAASPSPSRDSGEFVLVKKDGTQITAGAFFHQDSSIVYVTPAGARRTMPYSDLDVDATVLLNQERGTDLQLPL
jgi:hypothetical protein